jgi:hypothetical protein
MMTSRIGLGMPSTLRDPAVIRVLTEPGATPGSSIPENFRLFA